MSGGEADEEWLETLIEAMTRPVVCFHLPTDRLVPPTWRCEVCD